MHSKKKIVVLFTILSICFISLVVISCCLGSLSIGAGQLLRGLFVEYDATVHTIYDLRFPRIIVAVLAGAALSVSGVLFQAVLKNPLADPTIIGVTSGANFVAILIASFFPQFFFSIPLFAFIGGIISFVLVYILSWKKGIRPIRLVLVGVAISQLFQGAISVLGTIGGNSSSTLSVVETNLTMKTWSEVWILFIYVFIGLVLALLCCYSCNLLALEESMARSIGVNVSLLRILVSAVGVLLASIATAVVGIVSFIGLIVPHIARILVGSNHKVLIPFSALLGGFLLLLADTVGRTIYMPYEISAAVIMSIVGGPFFILLLRRSSKL